MFSSSEYKDLISTGVDVGFVALVESAYRVLFEAANVDSIYGEAAQILHIDTSDCNEDDASLKLERKVNDDPRFKAVDVKVTDVFNNVMDRMGFAYRDSKNEPVWVYPDVKNNEAVWNYIEKIKDALKLGILKKLDGLGEDSFYDALGRINDRRLSDGVIAEAFGLFGLGNILRRNRAHLSKNAMQEKLDIVKPHVLKGGSEFNKFIDVEPDTILPVDKLNVDKLKKVIKNHDGSAWFIFDGPEENPGLILIDLIFASGDLGIAMEMEDDRITNISHVEEVPGSLDISEMADDFVNFITSDSCRGFAEPFLNGHSEEHLLNLLQHLTPEHLVRLVRKAGSTTASNIRCLWKVADPSNFMTVIGPAEGYDELRFLIKCVDKGLVDSDDLSDWARFVMKYGFIVADDINIMKLADRYGVLRRDAVFNRTTIELDILKTDPNGFIEALTGTRGHADFNMLTDNDTIDVSELSRYSTEVLSDANIQMGLLNQRGFNGLLHELLSIVKKNKPYVPLAESVVENVFSGNNSISTCCLELNKYFSDILKYLLTTDGGTEVPQGNEVPRRSNNSARILNAVLSDIRKYMTPRVQSEILSHGDDEAKSWLKYYAEHVPGFRLADTEAYSDIVNCDNSDTITTYSDSITGNILLRKIREISANGQRPPDAALLAFIKMCMAPAVVKEVKANSALGRRIMKTFVRLTENAVSGLTGWCDLPIKYHIISKIPSLYNENSRYFDTYIKPNKRLFVLDSAGFLKAESFFAVKQIIDVLLSYWDLFVADSTLAENIFLKKGGIFSCNYQKLIVTPSKEYGVKPKKEMKNIDDKVARYYITLALHKSSGDARRDDGHKKGTTTLIKNVIAGQGLLTYLSGTTDVKNDNQQPTKIHNSETLESFGLNLDELTAALFQLSSWYDTNLSDGASRVITTDEIKALINSNPQQLLPVIGRLPSETASAVCKSCFTPETVQNMSTTPEGLELLLRLAAMGGWHDFTSQFVRAHEIKINSVINNMPAAEAARVKKMLAPYFSKGGEFSANSGSMASAELGKNVEYHEANGLLWMTGYYDGATGVKSSRNVMLYSMEDAEAIMAQLGQAGWRLPTVTELNNLGQDTGAIASKQLGFSPTGKADADGSMSPNSEYVCYAWCVDDDGDLCGYSVANNLIDTDADDIEDGDMLAIKLVK